MKKVLVLFSILVLGFMAGCSQPPAATSTTTKLLPDAAASSYASTGAVLAGSMSASMLDWAAGEIPSFSIKGSSVGSKAVTGPDANGWYHITATASSAGTSYNYDVYAKPTPATTPTSVDIYGTVNMSSGAGTYALTYGSASSPFRGVVTRSGSTISSITINGVIAMAITAPNAAGTGTDTINMTMTYSNLSMPNTSGNDYPTGSVVVAITYNGTIQPDMTLTFNGTATVSWAYGGTSGDFAILPASVD